MSTHPLPAALDLPEGFERHQPTRTQLREAIWALTPAAAATMPWPALLDHLVSVGRTDVPTSRLVEAHIDALRILHQAGATPTPGGVYAVWASRSHATGIRAATPAPRYAARDVARDAARDTACDVACDVAGNSSRADVLVLDGTLRFTSGAGVVDRALVPVWLDEDTHVLLDLAVAEWPFQFDAWRTRAMETTRTAMVQLDHVRVAAELVGAENSYLQRPGFAAGGVGVAAVWAGCAARVLDLLVLAVPVERRSETQTVRLGRVWTEVTAAGAVLRDAGPQLETMSASPGVDLQRFATEVRAAVGAGVRRVLSEARSIVGPAGLALDEDLTRAVDDTALFVAQQHEDNDAKWLGQHL